MKYILMMHAPKGTGDWAPLGPRSHRRGGRARQPDPAERSIGPYQLQAAIAAVHDEAARAEDTD
jgi:hypothetical protein